MTAWLWMSLLFGQQFNGNFDRMVEEVNRYRFDKALEQLLPVQAFLREKTGGKLPDMDAGMLSRMRSMGKPAAVLSAVALLRRHVEREEFADAHLQAVLAGLGLSALWGEMPAFRRLAFLEEDLAKAQGTTRLAIKKKVGYTAVEAQEWTRAAKIADELALEARHSAAILRGLVALGRGDETAAGRFLLDSMKGPGDLAMRNGGPNFQLAAELLRAGQKAVVLDFLKLVEASVWRESSKATDWRKALEAGQEVDFGRWNGVN